ncbi:hypothetical protein K438DRAFT_2013547 [Mycena galopus ATCC 62051]|nr:hypothetical protein K438DRAFT_2013547 [Mycena galopus ATCC 62051]
MNALKRTFQNVFRKDPVPTPPPPAPKYDIPPPPPPPPRVYFFALHPETNSAYRIELEDIEEGIIPTPSYRSLVPKNTSGLREPFPPAGPAEDAPGPELQISQPAHSLPAAAVQSTPVAEEMVEEDNSTKDSFPNTLELFIQVVGGILGDPQGYVFRNFCCVFLAICGELLHESPDVQDNLMAVMEEADGFVRGYLTAPRGIPVCITSSLEQIKPGTVAWGATNRHRNLAKELGYLQAAFNSAPCAAFERTFSDGVPTADTIRRRAQLGSLLAITFLHELNHVLIRQAFKTVFDMEHFLTPSLEIGLEGESGWQFEFIMFQGVIRSRWNVVDTTKADRFSRILDLWILGLRAARPVDGTGRKTAVISTNGGHPSVKGSYRRSRRTGPADKTSPLRLIADEDLSTFFDSIFVEGVLTEATIFSLRSGTGAGGVPQSQLEVPFQEVEDADRTLLRGEWLPGHMYDMETRSRFLSLLAAKFPALG